MRAKRYGICLLLAALIFLIATSISIDDPASAYAQSDVAATSEPFVFSVLYDDREVARFTEPKYLAPNHLIYEQMRERAIGADREEQKAKLLSLIEQGDSPRQALLTVFPALSALRCEVTEAIRLEPKDSRILFSPDPSPKFTIVREAAGRTLDEESFFEDVLLAFLLGKNRIQAKTVTVAPSVTAEQNKSYCFERARFSTDLSRSSADRAFNVALALSKLNGAVLEAGQTLSFNQTVGERTESNGFRVAKVILDGEYVDGVGGGVCQASTTLYNAALLSGLTVTGVRGHSLKPSYVDASFDAMVSFPSSDLTLKNDTGAPFFIAATVSDLRATVVVYGAKPLFRIARESVVTKTGSVPQDRVVTDSEKKYFSDGEAASEKRISYGAPQVESEGYLRYYRDGVLVKRERIRKDVYREKRGVVAKKV